MTVEMVGDMSSYGDIKADAYAAKVRVGIIDLLFEQNANHLPQICVSLGLRGGNRDESMGGKKSYVRSRIADLGPSDLVALGKTVYSKYPSSQLAATYDLEEAIFQYEDLQRGVITDIVRRQCVRLLGSTNLEGQLSRVLLVELLESLFPLITIAQDPAWPVDTVSGELQQHYVRNDDLTNDELLEKIGAYSCSTTRFIKLMDALVHPRIRHEDDTRHIVDTVNPTLARDGYSLLPNGKKISGYSIYTVQAIGKAGETPADQEISAAIAEFGEVEIHMRWQKALERRSSDPDGAITAARSLIETTCKHILDDANVAYADSEELPKLYTLTAASLNLAPSQHTADAYKRILGSCQSVVESLATIRNRMSDAHGVGRKAVRPLPRHAELAVNLSGSMCMFLIATWRAKKAGV